MTEMGSETGGCAVTSWWQGDVWLLGLPTPCHPCEDCGRGLGFFLWPRAGHSLLAPLVSEDNGVTVIASGLMVTTLGHIRPSRTRILESLLPTTCSTYHEAGTGTKSSSCTLFRGASDPRSTTLLPAGRIGWKQASHLRTECRPLVRGHVNPRDSW